MKTRYTPLIAAALLALPLALAAESTPDATSPMAGAMPLPPQPGAAAEPVLVPTPPAATPAPTPAEASAPAPAPATTTDPLPGDSVTHALQILGRPNGQFDMSDEVLYMFDRGTVMVSAAGIVEEVNLTPLANYEKIKAEEAQEQTEMQATHVRANALLDMLLSDPSYQSLATRDRILALHKFDRDHPGSDAPQDIKDLDFHLPGRDSRADPSGGTGKQNQAGPKSNQHPATAPRRRTRSRSPRSAHRTEIAEQEAAQAAAQQAAAQPQQILTDPFVVGPPGRHPGRPGRQSWRRRGGRHHPRRRVVEQPARPIIVNGSVKNSPANGTWVMQPDGTIKIITPDAGTN